MPSCDFYAVEQDCAKVLEYVFKVLGCRVFELYSPYDHQLAEFHSLAEITERYPLGKRQGSVHSVYLQLLAPSAGQVTIKRIALTPDSCDGATFRYTTHGWGLIKLYLGGVSPQGIVPSHTSHLSEKGARRQEASYQDELGSVSDWDWAQVVRTSRKLNTYIRKLSVQRSGTYFVLPSAASTPSSTFLP